MVETVIVCQINEQWGIWLPGCREHITRYAGQVLKNKAHVLYIIERIRDAWRNEYGDELPWTIQVIG